MGGGSPRINIGTTEGKGEWHDINRLEGTVWKRGKNGGLHDQERHSYLIIKKKDGDLRISLSINTHGRKC